MSMSINQRVATASATNQVANDDAPIKEDFKIRVVDPEPFDSVLMAKYVTTYELSNIVNSLFAPNLHDYYGCAIRPAETIQPNLMGAKPVKPTSNNPNVVLIAYFTDKGQPPENSGKVKCLEPIVKGNDLVERLNRLNNIMRNRNYTLTDDAKSMLMDFVDDSFKHQTRSGKKVPNWSQIVTEVADQTSQGIRACVSIQLDILKVLREIYKSNVGDRRYDYAIYVAKSGIGQPSQYPGQPYMMPQQWGLSTEYMYQIVRYDMTSGGKVLQQIGLTDSGSSLNIVRA